MERNSACSSGRISIAFCCSVICHQRETTTFFLRNVSTVPRDYQWGFNVIGQDQLPSLLHPAHDLLCKDTRWLEHHDARGIGSTLLHRK